MKKPICINLKLQSDLYLLCYPGLIYSMVNNAGTNKGFRPLLQFNDDDIQQIVSTNLVGSILCTHQALRIMNSQRNGGHIFNMDGAGSGGSSTPLTAVYGATKCGLRQLQSSLLKECRRSKVGIHTASPGMVLTELLLSGSSVQNKQMFNIICELPETVARTLVPRMRVVKGSGRAINYLTPPRILLALVTAWLRRGRWFDDQGRALYAAEADRLRNWAEIQAARCPEPDDQHSTPYAAQLTHRNGSHCKCNSEENLFCTKLSTKRKYRGCIVFQAASLWCTAGFPLLYPSP
ncbi:putative chlorophyll(ide) b reductase NYC1, chloroplastic [Sesamum angolense]|uniref:Chlorophyll(Ide) b reductase NYC1, chloroplastic n=1 Tax=Sesamum angolense TaxID=2727404 RepID=A0AAE1WNX9_9LAMI|nr:putative chlorophyll(ide) b reductase NYC1, chloroplastic [Sesamum angolense]